MSCSFNQHDWNVTGGIHEIKSSGTKSKVISATPEDKTLRN